MCTLLLPLQTCEKRIKMKLSVSAYRAQASAHKKILNSSYQMLLNYGATCTTSQLQQQTSKLGLPSVKVGRHTSCSRMHVSVVMTCSRPSASTLLSAGPICASRITETALFNPILWRCEDLCLSPHRESLFILHRSNTFTANVENNETYFISATLT